MRNLIFLIYLIAASPACATQYYVSTTGNDSSAGTQAAPFQSMYQASGVVKAGDTVHVLPGTYDAGTYAQSCTLPVGGIGLSFICQSTSGIAGAPITYVSDVQWGARLVCTGSEAVFPFPMQASYITIKGFYVSCPDSDFGIVGGLYGNTGHATYQNNYIYAVTTSFGCVSSGMLVGSDTGNATFTNEGFNTFDGNIIRYIGANDATTTECNQDHGIYDGSPHATVINNVISGVVGIGIHLYGGGVCNDLVANNTVFDNNNGGIIVENTSASGSYQDVCGNSNSTDHNVVINNIVVNNGFAHAFNGTPYNGASPGIEMYGANMGAHNIIANNIAVGNNLAYTNTLGGPTAEVVAGAPTVPVQTLFTPSPNNVLSNYQVDKNWAPTANYNYMNYSIFSGSVARGFAVSPVPSHDVNGDLRNTVDAGAFHYILPCDLLPEC